jgi:hypothetical protein
MRGVRDSVPCTSVCDLSPNTINAIGIVGHLVNTQYLFLAGNQASPVCTSLYFELQGPISKQNQGVQGTVLGQATGPPAQVSQILTCLTKIACSETLHKRVHNCCTTLDGLDSNHHAVAMDLNLTSIKYKEKLSMNCRDINWRKICEEDEQRKLYNKYFLELTTMDMSYDNFCKAVVRSGKETAVAIDRKCKGWYTASKSILAPAIQEKNRLRHRLHNRSGLSPNKEAEIKAQLKVINKCNHDLVELAKACWYKGICEKVHKMRMDPRLAWENIRILTGGETAHHKTNLNMSMHLATGKLASNAKENMSVFGVHFDKVLNNHRPVNHSVLDLLKQKPCMTLIDNPITFSEVKQAINKLKKGKLPGLNRIPPKHSKQWITSHNEQSIAMFASSLKVKSTMKDGIKANVSPYQSKAT